MQVWAGGLLSHEVGRAVSHHLECSVTNILAEYHGESGDNAVHRLGQHEDAIKRKDKKNAMAKHLEIFHPENIGDPDSFNYSSVATFRKRLER